MVAVSLISDGRYLTRVHPRHPERTHRRVGFVHSSVQIRAERALRAPPQKAVVSGFDLANELRSSIENRKSVRLGLDQN